MGNNIFRFPTENQIKCVASLMSGALNMLGEPKGFNGIEKRLGKAISRIIYVYVKVTEKDGRVNIDSNTLKES